MTTVAYLGPAGTYTEEAARLFFGGNDEMMPQATVADKLPGMLDASCPEGTKLAYVHDRPEKSALGMYRYVIELERENGFSDEEISRLEGIDGLEYLGRYSRIEG